MAAGANTAAAEEQQLCPQPQSLQRISARVAHAIIHVRGRQGVEGADLKQVAPDLLASLRQRADRSAAELKLPPRLQRDALPVQLAPDDLACERRRGATPVRHCQTQSDATLAAARRPVAITGAALAAAGRVLLSWAPLDAEHGCPRCCNSTESYSHLGALQEPTDAHLRCR